MKCGRMNRNRIEGRMQENRERYTIANDGVMRMDYPLTGVYTDYVARDVYYVGKEVGSNGCPLSEGGSRRCKMYRKSTMTWTTISVLLLCFMTSTVAAQQPEVVTLRSKALTNIPDKEGVMITVEYPPGGADPVHRHNAQAFVYVLEGSVVMQVKGGNEVTLTPGQTFYEGLDDVHVVGRNASLTRPAKMLVFLVKDKGAPILVPIE